MSQIIIKELYDSDDILELVEKTNWNFDQLLAAGGGPEGPAGPQGPEGPAGSRGIRGSEWFAASGATSTINVPTDGEFRDNDFRLEDDGTIQYYLAGSTGPDAPWVDSGINIKGPTGPTGPAGDGSISVIHSEPSPTVGAVVPNVSLPGLKTLNGHIISATNANDEVDYDKGSVGYINAGLDYALIGQGNNSLVLASYLKMFRDNGTFDPYFTGFPTEEVDVPMLIIGQNDYMDPNPTLTPGGKDPLPEFKNGIAIGLNLTQGSSASDYDPIYSTPYFANYDSFTRLGVINRNADFAIQSVGHIELRSTGTNKIRLSAGYSRDEIKDITEITEWSNFYNTDTYTEFAIGDNIAITDDRAKDPTVDATTKQFITSMGGISLSSNSSKAKSGSLVDSINSTVFGRNDNATSAAHNANEIIIVNDRVEEKEVRGDKYNGRRKISDKTYDYRNSNTYKDTQLRFGQVRAEVSHANGTAAKNFFYLGQAYDAPIIGYSSMNFRVTSGSYALNGGTASARALLPEDAADYNFLGYNILDGFAPGGESSVDSDKSLSRLGVFPGFLNQRRDAAGNLDPSDPDGDKNLELYIDEGHKKLPTGSLDLYGTVRIREYGLAENKTGQVAVNAGHGIVKWEESTKIGVPTGGIIMVGEIRMSNFNFFTRTTSAYGSTATSSTTLRSRSTYWAYDTNNGAGSTAAPNHWSMAFPGKGSDEWEGYYICNGAILADARDVFARGAFSTVKGLNAYASNRVMPGLTENPYYDHYNDYTGTIFYNATGSGSGYIGPNNPTGFKNLLINIANNFTDLFGSKGLSLLSPPDNDSGFRVVLPNYFGRFPKQMFPDSNTMELNNHDSAASWNFTDGSAPVTTYYRQNSNGTYIINPKYPLKSGYYNGGFPYLRNEELPVHQHYMGRFTEIETGGGGSSIKVYEAYTTFDANGTMSLPDRNTYFSRTSGWPTSEHRSGDKGDADRNIGTGIYDYYMYRDWSRTDGGKWANWQNDETINSVRARSQKFHDPVFKGTYFAINLRGLRNPGRGDTLIPDFDFVAGVPMAGFRNKSGVLTSDVDLSWYGNAADILVPASGPGYASPTRKGRTDVNQLILQQTAPISLNLKPTLGQEAINEFEVTWRNENHTHPFSIVDEGDEIATKELNDVYQNIYTDPNNQGLG